MTKLLGLEIYRATSNDNLQELEWLFVFNLKRAGNLNPNLTLFPANSGLRVRPVYVVLPRGWTSEVDLPVGSVNAQPEKRRRLSMCNRFGYGQFTYRLL